MRGRSNDHVKSVVRVADVSWEIRYGEARGTSRNFGFRLKSGGFIQRSRDETDTLLGIYPAHRNAAYVFYVSSVYCMSLSRKKMQETRVTFIITVRNLNEKRAANSPRQEWAPAGVSGLRKTRDKDIDISAIQRRGESPRRCRLFERPAE